MHGDEKSNLLGAFGISHGGTAQSGPPRPGLEKIQDSARILGHTQNSEMRHHGLGLEGISENSPIVYWQARSQIA